MTAFLENLLIPYTLNSSGRLIHVSEASKADSYTCVECGQPLHLKEGLVKVKHLAHKSLTSCSGGTGEGWLHKTGKSLIKDFIEDRVCKKKPLYVQWKSQFLDTQNKYNLLCEIDRVELEYRFDKGFTPDIALFSGGLLRAVVEVVVSHKIEDKAFSFYADEKNADVLEICLQTFECLKKFKPLTRYIPGLDHSFFDGIYATEDDYWGAVFDDFHVIHKGMAWKVQKGQNYDCF